jgi:hypothetical protein
MMLRAAISILLLLFTTVSQGYAQRNENTGNPFQAKSVNLMASATLLDNLVLATIRDVNLDGPNAVESIVTVSPVSSPYSGLMRIDGRPGKTVRITYLTNETLVEEGGSGGFVKARYQISGFDKDNQLASILLDAGEATVRLGQDGKYYLWLGAILDLSAAQPGNYNSEFILEIEGN